MAVIRGANAPVIIRTIQEQLDHEHKVIEGKAQRKPVITQKTKFYYFCFFLFKYFLKRSPILS